ncbi:MAG: ATP-grasp domain-containing protein [Candidatus Hadarchaeales archaeon]
MEDLRTVLVVGVNTRPVVKSVRALGLRAVAVDRFRDLDLCSLAEAVLPPPPSLPHERLDWKGLCLRALEEHEVDAVLCTSGMEHQPELLKELERRGLLVGNRWEQVRRARRELFRTASRLGIPFPPTEEVRSPEEAEERAEELGYPVVLKPLSGGGGRGMTLARSDGEVESGFRLASSSSGRALVQKYVPGRNASASLLCGRGEAVCLTVNEQLIGEAPLGAPGPFSYCGGVVPLGGGREVEKVVECVEALCSELGLVGSNGVDFVLREGEPWVVEVNPRFQGTLEQVEGVLGINLVEEHLRWCGGGGGEYGEAKGCSVKLVLYARKETTAPDLRRFPGVVDLPWRGQRVGEGQPVCSVLEFAPTREEALGRARRTASEVRRLLD